MMAASRYMTPAWTEGQPPLRIRWLFREARLGKVLIESKSNVDAQLLHDNEKKAIRE